MKVRNHIADTLLRRHIKDVHESLLTSVDISSGRHDVKYFENKLIIALNMRWRVTSELLINYLEDITFRGDLPLRIAV